MKENPRISRNEWDFSGIADSDLHAAYVHEYSRERPLKGKRPTDKATADYWVSVMKKAYKVRPESDGYFYLTWWFGRFPDDHIKRQPWPELTDERTRYANGFLYRWLDGEPPETDAHGESLQWTEPFEVAAPFELRHNLDRQTGDPDDSIEIDAEYPESVFIPLRVNLKHYTPRQIATEFERLLSSLKCQRVKKRGPGATRHRAALDNLAIVRIRHNLNLGQAMELYEQSHLREKFCDLTETLDRAVISQRIRDAQREVSKHFARVNSDLAKTAQPASLAERAL